MGARGPKPGQKVGGRTKGTPNKYPKALKDMILTALSEVGGADYLVKQASNDPRGFMTLIGKTLPLSVKNEGDEPFRLIVERRVAK